MSKFKNIVENILASIKEADLASHEEVARVLKNTNDISSASQQEIVDGLLNSFNTKEEALQALSKYLSKVDDGYKSRNPQVLAAKNRLERMIALKQEDSDDTTEYVDNWAKDDARDIETALDVDNKMSNSNTKFEQIVNEALAKYKLKEWGNYPDDYNWRNNPYEAPDSDDDQGYQDALDDLETGYSALLLKNNKGEDLTDRHGYALDKKYGLLYVGKEDGTIDGLIDTNVLSSNDYDQSVFPTQEEAIAFGEKYKQLNPLSQYSIVEVYSTDSSDPENWYKEAEEAYPYEKYQDEAGWGESIQTVKNEDAKDFQKPERASTDSQVYQRKNAVKDEEMYQYAINGIHPYMDYKKPMWRQLKSNGEKFVFVLDGIDKEHSDPNKETYVYIRPVKMLRTEGGRWIKKYGDLEAITVNAFLDVVYNELNTEILDHVLKGESHDPEDWVEELNRANKSRAASYDEWREMNKDRLDLDSYDTFTQKKIYQAIEKDGYSPKEALAKFANKKINQENAELDEANDIIKDPHQLKKLLPELNIDPAFIEVPMTLEYPDMGDDTEPTVKYIITGIPNEPIEQVREVFVKDWDKGGRSFPMDLKTVKEIISRDINIGAEPDLWDLASTPNKQTRSLNKGTTGKWQELTKEQVESALRIMETRPEFQGIDLVGKFYAKQTYETRNPLVGKALKMLDPEAGVMPKRSKTAMNGISYQIFIPHEESLIRKPPAKGHSNPYKDLTKTW